MNIPSSACHLGGGSRSNDNEESVERLVWSVEVISAGAGRYELENARSSTLDVKFSQADGSMFSDVARVENGRGGSHEGGCVQIEAEDARESACGRAALQGLNSAPFQPTAWCPQSA